MRFPIAEIMDRMSILKLKIEHFDKPELRKEYANFEKELDNYKKEGFPVRKKWLDELYTINSKIWILEADIRDGREGKFSLEEVGRRALKIRDYNKERIAIKNKIIEATGIGHKDVKVHHASDER
jgi:hypothetical protein